MAHVSEDRVLETSTTIPTNTAFMGPTLQMSNGTANTTVTTTAMEVMAFSCQSDN